MNRVIKFRAWDTVLKKWNFSIEVDCFGRLQEYKYNGSSFYAKYYNDFDDTAEKANERFVLQQFTGVIDKYGKEIYEGDVVKVVLPDYDEIHTYAIAWHQGFCCFGYLNLEFVDIINYAGDAIVDQVDYQHIIEVIGNIYENPELVNL